jgi:hypothetical protein
MRIGILTFSDARVRSLAGLWQPRLPPRRNRVTICSGVALASVSEIRMIHHPTVTES